MPIEGDYFLETKTHYLLKCLFKEVFVAKKEGLVAKVEVPSW